jgi:hypothetical protein
MGQALNYNCELLFFRTFGCDMATRSVNYATPDPLSNVSQSSAGRNIIIYAFIDKSEKIRRLTCLLHGTI